MYMKGKVAFILSKKFLSNALLICTNISSQNEPDSWFTFVEIQLLKKIYREIMWNQKFNSVC